MKKLWIGFTGVVFALTLFSTATAKTKWDMHLNYPAGNFHTEGAQKFADEVAKARWPLPRSPPAWWKGTRRYWH